MNVEERIIAEIGGIRLDQFLARRLPGYSRSHLKDLVERGMVSVDGVLRRPDFRVSAGSVIRLKLAIPGWPSQPLEDWILHEDKDILVLDKPAGLVVHPIGESWERRPEAALHEPEPNLAGLLIKHRPGLLGSGISRCGIVHRLDRQTSGVLVVAKTAEAQETLLAGFRERLLSKAYRAIVLGELSTDRVEAPVGRLPGRRRVQVTPWGRESSTEFKSMESSRGLSLVEARPKTGRTHQIRVHLALLKLPVLGDHEWFRAPEKEALRKLGLPAPPRMMLHSYRLRLTHPATGKPVSYTAPLPKDFKDYWKAVQGGK